MSSYARCPRRAPTLSRPARAAAVRRRTGVGEFDANAARRGEGHVSLLSALALISGVVCALAPLAQAKRIVLTGAAHDVLMSWLALYAMGSLVRLAYGPAIATFPLIISQAIAFSSAGTVLMLARRYRRTGKTIARRHDERPGCRSPPRATTPDATQSRPQ